jgi:hypothetical protein
MREGLSLRPRRRHFWTHDCRHPGTEQAAAFRCDKSPIPIATKTGPAAPLRRGICPPSQRLCDSSVTGATAQRTGHGPRRDEDQTLKKEAANWGGLFFGLFGLWLLLLLNRLRWRACN